MTQKTISEPSLERSPNASCDYGVNGETAVAHKDAAISENKYRVLFETSPVSLWEVDFSKVNNFLISFATKGQLTSALIFVTTQKISFTVHALSELKMSIRQQRLWTITTQ